MCKSNWNSAKTAISGFLLLMLGGCRDTSSDQQSPDTYSTLVNAEGDIRFPSDFPAGYQFIGTWTVADGDDVKEIHSVYARPSDVTSFQATGSFPDGAVLIKEVSRSRGARHTTGNANWAHNTETWFMMIKDANGRFPSNALWGDGWGWAQFDPKRSRQIATSYRADCQACHIPAKASDWVYTYAYPSLGHRGQAHVPKSESGHVEEVGSEQIGAARSSGNTSIAAGEIAFQKTCIACHSATAGRNSIGPSLAGVVGRRAGIAPGYAFSSELSNSGIIWTPENIDKHLEKPRDFVPGNKMGNLFPAGVPDAEKRRDIIVYLQTLK